LPTIAEVWLVGLSKAVFHAIKGDWENRVPGTKGSDFPALLSLRMNNQHQKRGWMPSKKHGIESHKKV